MKIGIDVTFLFDQYAHRGIGTYAREVVSRMILSTEHEWVLFGFKDLKSNLKELENKGAKNISFVSLGKSRKSTIVNPLFFNLSFKHKVKKANLDIFFAPHFERGLPRNITKTAVMVHDAIPFLTNSYSQKNALTNFIKGIFYRRNLNIAKKVDLILTNSEFTKTELVKKVGFPQDKISVTPLAVSPEFKKENIHSDTRSLRRILVMYKITQPYILYYGGLEENKNSELLLQAFSKVTSKHPDLKLVIAGKEFKLGWDGKPKPTTSSAEKLLDLLSDLKLQHKVIFTGEIKQIHLPVVLHNASCFVSLSGYEGFGLSVLEAISSGVPVVASDKSSYPEVLGKGALLVDPKNTDLVADKIKQVLQDDGLRQRLVRAGQLQANTFSWEKTASLTTQNIENTVTKNPKLNITYVITKFYPEHGGAEVNCYEIAKRMVNKGHRVTVLTANNIKNSLPQSEIIEGIVVKRSRRFNNQYYLGFYPGMFRLLLFTKADLIHIHGFGFFWQDLFLIITKVFKRKTVFINTPHGPFMAHGNYSLFKILLKKSYITLQRIFLNRLYSYVIQVNPEQYKWLKSYGINTSKIKYLPNGINEYELNLIKTDKAVEDNSLKRRFVIAYTGRFEEYKGIQQVIKVLPKLTKIKSNIRFVVMGRGGDYLVNLQTLARNLGVEQYIVFIINPEDKARDEILAFAKVFVMPSRWEAFGISILEAMSKKCAVISTKTEGGKFLIKDKENGFLYDYDDQKALVKSFEVLLKDTRLLTKIQKTNYDVVSEYLWDKISDDYQDFILDLS